MTSAADADLVPASDDEVADRHASWISRVTALAIVGFSLSWVLVMALAGLRFYRLSSDVALDVELYHDYAQQMLAGLLPYRDFAVEYPPLALIPMLVPALMAGLDEAAYRQAFQLFHAGVGMVTMIVVMRTVAVLRPPRRDVIAAAAVVALSPLLLGPLMLARYDLWPALFAALAVYWIVLDRRRLAGVALGLGIAAKVYPVVLGPFVLLFLWRRHGLRAAVDFAAATAITVAVTVAPFALLAPDGVFDALFRNFRRPLQVESSAATVLYAWNEIAPFGLQTVHTFDSYNIAMAPAPAAATIQTGLLVVAILAFLAVFLRGRMTVDRLLIAVAGALCAWVALGTVLSPQYLMWLIAPLAVVAFRRGAVHLVVLGAAVLLTGIYYPAHYGDYFDAQLAPWIAVVAGRNALLLALAAYCLVRLRDDAATRAPLAGPATPLAGPATPLAGPATPPAGPSESGAPVTRV